MEDCAEEYSYPINVYYNNEVQIIDAIPDEKLSLFYDQIASLYSFSDTNDFDIFFDYSSVVSSSREKFLNTTLSNLLQPGDSVYVIGGTQRIDKSIKAVSSSISQEEARQRYYKFISYQTVNHVGITNIGNTCYFAALIQALYALKPLREIIINHRIPSSSLENNKKFVLLKNLKTSFMFLQEAKTVLVPIELLKTFKELHPIFGERDENGLPKQQDSAEAFITLIDDIAEVINSSLIKSSNDYINNLIASIKSLEEKSRKFAPIDILFNIDIEDYNGEDKVIDNKNNNNNNNENENKNDENEQQEIIEKDNDNIDKVEDSDISEGDDEKIKEKEKDEEEKEEKQKNTSIQKAFDIHINKETSHLQFAIEETLKVKVEVFSDITHVSRMIEKETKISKLPELLTFQMCRFAYDRNLEKQQKILRKVNYPMELDMFQYVNQDVKKEIQKNREIIAKKKSEMMKENCTKEQIDEELSNMHLITGWYKLSSVIAHKGMSANSGHYVSYIRTDDNKWALCDDDVVEEVTHDEVAAAAGGNSYTAYLIFYTASSDSIL